MDRALPQLLEKTLARGWRALVRTGDPRGLEALDAGLWTYSDDSFLPHGLEADDGARQPVVLVSHGGNPNGADVRFIVDGASLPADASGYRRLVVMFDGNDDEALGTARERWREVETSAGPIAATLPPANLEGVAPAMGAVPSLGQHTETVLRSAGYSSSAIETLRASGAIG